MDERCLLALIRGRRYTDTNSKLLSEVYNLISNL